jgi:hypothetical protein
MIRRIQFVVITLLTTGILAYAQVGPLVGMGPLPRATVSRCSVPTSLGASISASGAGSSATVTTSGNIVAGAAVFIVVGMNTTNSVTPSSVSDGTNTYSEGPEVAQTLTNASIWYKFNASAVSSGATVTINFSGASGTANDTSVAIAQSTGCVGVYDKHGTGAGTSTPITTTSTGTLSSATELAIGGAVVQGSSSAYSATSPFINVNSAVNTSPGYGVALDYESLSATTAITYTAAWTSPTRLVAVVATFE